MNIKAYLFFGIAHLLFLCSLQGRHMSLFSGVKYHTLCRWHLTHRGVFLGKDFYSLHWNRPICLGSPRHPYSQGQGEVELQIREWLELCLKCILHYGKSYLECKQHHMDRQWSQCDKCSILCDSGLSSQHSKHSHRGLCISHRGKPNDPHSHHPPGIHKAGIAHMGHPCGFRGNSSWPDGSLAHKQHWFHIPQTGKDFGILCWCMLYHQDIQSHPYTQLKKEGLQIITILSLHRCNSC